MVTPLDDFDPILGLKFMRDAKALPVPSLNCIILMSDPLCIMPKMQNTLNEKKFLSALQFKKGVKKGEPMFVIVPQEEKEESLTKSLT